MLQQIGSMRCTQEVGTFLEETDKNNEIEHKTFRYVKNTPEVQATLASIKQMDEEISSQIDLYKAERAERLLAQQEMCKKLSDDKICMEKNTDLFLELCDFEMASDLERKNDYDNDLNYSNQFPAVDEIKWNYEDFSKDFIKRNKELAKEGAMASFSLTDEEKSKLEDLLSEVADPEVADLPNSATTKISDLPSHEEHESMLSIECNNDNTNATAEEYVIEDNTDPTTNAFSFSQSEKDRINDINSALKDFEGTEERTEESKVKLKDESFWKQFILEQSLKDIDDKLEQLQQKYMEDERKLSNAIPRSYNTAFEFTDEEVRNSRELLQNSAMSDFRPEREIVATEDTDSTFSSEC